MSATLNRRQLLWLMAIAGAGAHAHPILRTLGPVTAPYLQGYFRRMWEWYAREFADLKINLTAAERELLPAWQSALTTWGYPVAPDQLFEHFRFAHRVHDGHVDSRRFALGLSRWPGALGQTARTLARHRGVRWSMEEDPYFFGLGWNFADDETKAYFLYPQARLVTQPELKCLSVDHPSNRWHEARLGVCIHRRGKAAGRQLIVPLRALDWAMIDRPPVLDASAALKIIGAEGPARWHFRLRSLFFPTLSEASHPLLAKHATEFQQPGHSLLFASRERYTLYYP